MKKIFVCTLLLLSLFSANAETTYEEGPNNVKVTVVNSISPWFITNADNIGLALSVTSGSCKVEISSDFPKNCTNNTAIPFDWDVGAPLTSGQKKFLSYTSGISCVRANCSSGTGLFLVRKH